MSLPQRSDRRVPQGRRHPKPGRTAGRWWSATPPSRGPPSCSGSPTRRSPRRPPSTTASRWRRSAGWPTCSLCSTSCWPSPPGSPWTAIRGGRWPSGSCSRRSAAWCGSVVPGSAGRWQASCWWPSRSRSCSTPSPGWPPSCRPGHARPASRSARRDCSWAWCWRWERVPSSAATTCAALMVGEAVVAVLAAAAYLVVRRRSPEPDRVEAPEVGELRRVWTDPVLRRIAVLAFLGFGVFVALITWLQALLEPRGVSETAAGTIVTVAVAVGAIGSTVVAAVLERRAVEVALLRTALVVAAGGCAVLAASGGVAGAALGAILAVLAMLTALPWLLSLCERRAHRSVASATALLWLAGNLGGLVVAVVVGGLVDWPTAAFALLGAVALVGIPLVRARALGLGDGRRRPGRRRDRRLVRLVGPAALPAGPPGAAGRRERARVGRPPRRGRRPGAPPRRVRALVRRALRHRRRPGGPVAAGPRPRPGPRDRRRPGAGGHLAARPVARPARAGSGAAEPRRHRPADPGRSAVDRHPRDRRGLRQPLHPDGRRPPGHGRRHGPRARRPGDPDARPAARGPGLARRSRRPVRGVGADGPGLPAPQARAAAALADVLAGLDELVAGHDHVEFYAMPVLPSRAGADLPAYRRAGRPTACLAHLAHRRPAGQPGPRPAAAHRPPGAAQPARAGAAHRRAAQRQHATRRKPPGVRHRAPGAVHRVRVGAAAGRCAGGG